MFHEISVLPCCQVFCPNSNISVLVNDSTVLVHDCSNLQPETNYTIAVSAVNGVGSSPNGVVMATTACEGTHPLCVDADVSHDLNLFL